MPYNEKSYAASVKYKAAKIKRVPLDLQISEYEELKQAAVASGMSVNGYIKQAIRDAIAAGVQAIPVGDNAGAVVGVVTPVSTEK